MGWSCRRPGCSREAEVCISYDAVACQVWLDPIVGGPSGGQPLCQDHASRLNVPRGWVIVDRRESQASFMMSATSATEPEELASEHPRQPAVARRVGRGWGQFEAPKFEFVASEPVAAVAIPDHRIAAVFLEKDEPAEQVAAEPAEVVEPVAVVEPKKPKGRLLSRAFESAGPQRSVLTEASLGRTDVQDSAGGAASTKPSAAEPYIPDAHS